MELDRMIKYQWSQKKLSRGHLLGGHEIKMHLEMWHYEAGNILYMYQKGVFMHAIRYILLKVYQLKYHLSYGAFN